LSAFSNLQTTWSCLLVYVFIEKRQKSSKKGKKR